MTYITNLKAIQIGGLDRGRRIVDENVGTGDNSKTSYDLANNNVISGSYTLSYAASGSNSFTDLTETTDYTLDKESGRVNLTSSGVTTLGTNILYAKYTYNGDITDTDITNFETLAEAEVNLLTGRNWGTATAYIEYITGRQNFFPPSTNQPYAPDWDEPKYLILEKTPVLRVDKVYFLNRTAVIQKVYSYASATYTDNTTKANAAGGTSFYVFASTPIAQDIIYIGGSEIFLGLDTDLAVLGTGSPAINWEFYNGTAWASLTVTDTDSGASTFTASGKFIWTMPDNWAKSSVNSSGLIYWVRGRLTTAYTISPKIRELSFDQNSVISTQLNIRNIDYTSYGKLTLMSNSIPSGTKNIRVEYQYGSSTVPALIEELTGILTALRCFVKLSGGSYDEYTSISSSAVAATIGEQYVNIREVIVQFKSRVDEIVKLMGGRADFVVAAT